MFIFRIFALLSALAFQSVAMVSVAQAAEGYSPPRAAYLIDVETGAVLFDENADSLRHPASLTKMMTLYLTFEAITEGRLTLEAPVPFSRHAADQAPSRLGVPMGEAISVDTAIDALVVRSANDVAAAMGELLGGTETDFAALMTQKAQALGMTNTVFKNASGLPNKEQVTTARDMATLGLSLKRDFPDFYKRFSGDKVQYGETVYRSHNRMLSRVPGVSGIKTGFINASGFNIVTYAEQGLGAKLVVVMGGRSAAERDQIAVDLLDGKAPAHLANAGKALPDPLPVEPTQQIDTIVVGSIAPSAQNAAKPSGIAIEVGTMRTSEAAHLRLSLLHAPLAELGLALAEYVEFTENGTQLYHSAQLVGFPTMGHAQSACATLAAMRVQCSVLGH